MARWPGLAQHWRWSSPGGGRSVLVSGGSGADPRTPPALPGLPPPFLGTAVVGSGGPTAAIDAYGDVVDLRRRAGGAGADRQPGRAAGGRHVPVDTGIVPRVSVGGGPFAPLWRADHIGQRYLAGTNVDAHRGQVRQAWVAIADAAAGRRSPSHVRGPHGRGSRAVGVNLVDRGHLPASGGAGRRRELSAAAALADRALGEPARRRVIHARSDRRWLAGRAPWAERARLGTASVRRSLLVLRALTDRRTGAVAAGAGMAGPTSGPATPAPSRWRSRAAGYRAEAPRRPLPARPRPRHRGSFPWRRGAGLRAGGPGRRLGMGRRRHAGRRPAPGAPGAPLAQPGRLPRGRPRRLPRQRDRRRPAGGALRVAARPDAASPPIPPPASTRRRPGRCGRSRSRRSSRPSAAACCA